MTRIIALLAIFLSTAVLQAGNTAIEVEISAEDIPRFWAAYDRAKNASDRAAVFQTLFIDKVDARVRQFIRPSSVYASMTLHYPRFWESIRRNTERIAEKKEEMQRSFQRFAEIYPAFHPPKLHFSISACQTGGTVKDGIIFFGTEILTADATTDKEEFRKFPFYQVLGSTGGDVTVLVTHELVHSQQPLGDNARGTTLLEQTVTEGAAEFVTILLTGKITFRSAWEYGYANERRLLEEFRLQMEGKEYSNWLYNMAHTPRGRPADLGYFLGFRICQAYYRRQADKKKALAEIIECRDFHALLERSGYGGEGFAFGKE
ncbi:MAG TPA: DUF2268 domain-containing putative Zn-dependent protease [Geobacteraceae bacterium]|nr:DUF2268 domain-containing putative Zn-dependent protease [Geobacteraceae bacterium]